MLPTIAIVLMVFINMFMIYFNAKQLLNMRDYFDASLEMNKPPTREEIQSAYQTGSMSSWFMFSYALKMMYDESLLLDYESILDGVDKRLPKIPKDVMKKISNGINPLGEDGEDGPSLY